MRSYKIDFDRVANQLVPHYLGGRSFILFIQSLLKPLQKLNDGWKDWARNQIIDAQVTSQVIVFEQYLTHKYRQYFVDKLQRVSFFESNIKGIPLYEQSVERSTNDMILYNEADKAPENPALQWEYQGSASGNYDFEISCPSCDTSKISKEDFQSMFTYDIERYKIAGMNYKIHFN